MNKNKKKNEVEDDDGIKIVNARIFPIHFQPNATGDRILRSSMGRSFDSFRTIFKENYLDFLEIVLMINILIFEKLIMHIFQ